jgi:hypothetical protein
MVTSPAVSATSPSVKCTTSPGASTAIIRSELPRVRWIGTNPTPRPAARPYCRMATGMWQPPILTRAGYLLSPLKIGRQQPIFSDRQGRERDRQRFRSEDLPAAVIRLLDAPAFKPGGDSNGFSC